MGPQFVALSIDLAGIKLTEICLPQNWIFTLFCFEGSFHSWCISTVSDTCFAKIFFSL